MNIENFKWFCEWGHYFILTFSTVLIVSRLVRQCMVLGFMTKHIVKYLDGAWKWNTLIHDCLCLSNMEEKERWNNKEILPLGNFICWNVNIGGGTSSPSTNILNCCLTLSCLDSGNSNITLGGRHDVLIGSRYCIPRGKV